MVERPAVNRQVLGSSPSRGVLDRPAKAGRFSFWKARAKLEPVRGPKLAGLAEIWEDRRRDDGSRFGDMGRGWDQNTTPFGSNRGERLSDSRSLPFTVGSRLLPPSPAPVVAESPGLRCSQPARTGAIASATPRPPPFRDAKGHRRGLLGPPSALRHEDMFPMESQVLRSNWPQWRTKCAALNLIE